MARKFSVRLLSLLLMLLTVVGVLAACADNPDQPGTETKSPSETEPEDTRVTSDLPDMNLEGYEFTVMQWYVTAWPDRMNKDLVADETTGDPINDAVYSRNARLAEKYNFTIAMDNYINNEVIAMIRSAVSTGDDMFDMVSARVNDVPPVLLEGSFLDFETSFKYINLDKPYWDQSVRNSLSFANRVYLMSSSMCLSDQDATSAVAFNKQYAKDYNMPDFYDIVRKGQWTFEKIYESMTAFDGDTNGDGKMNPDDDIFGFLGGDDVMMSFFFGGGGTFTEKDEDDLPEFNFAAESNYDIVDSVLDIMYDDSFLNHHAISNVDDGYYRSLFIDGHGLFFWMRMDDVITMRGEEAIDFGILPVPKFNEEQENYLSLISQHTSGLMSVLTCEQNTDFVGFCLEAISAASYYDLQKAYYDVTLKTKSARDDESQDMLDLIFSHRILDIGEIFNFGGFSSTFLSYGSHNQSKKLKAIASTYASAESKIESDIESFLDKIEKLESYAA
ncbi:MAG: hypothetical protein MJ070_11190 [Lachnospiraceae bacterium]|nr:hypothetical protein [Lachnospiraceae bacterium]